MGKFYNTLVVTANYDAKRDVRRVEPVLNPTISDMLCTGVVPPEAEACEFAKEVNDPSMIVGRVTDVFAAIRERRRIVSSAALRGAENAASAVADAADAE